MTRSDEHEAEGGLAAAMTRAFGWLGAGLDDANQAMLRQFYVNLLIQHAACPPPDPAHSSPDAALRAAAHAQAEALLRPAADPSAPPEALSWASAYRAEQLIVLNLPPEALADELARQAAGLSADDPEHQALSARSAAALQDAARPARPEDAAPPPGPEALRQLLGAVIKARQWKKTSRMQIRTMAARYRRRLNLWFIFALILFLAVLFVAPNMLMPLDWTRGPGGGYSGLLTALCAGFFGASFSALVGSRSVVAGNIEEMRAMASSAQIIARLLVGGGGAAIVYFFFETELIAGVAVPDLNHLTFDRIAPETGPPPGSDDDLSLFGIWIPNAEISLLMIWSFLAGFSESFVPRMLTQVEGAAHAGGAGKDRP